MSPTNNMVKTAVSKSVRARLGAALLFLFSAAFRLDAQVELERENNDRISIVINGQPFGTLYIGSASAKPFLAPLRTATGVIVSRRYPMEEVEGESRDHPHHQGLWIGYGDVNGVNFWENDAASRPSGANPKTKGRIVLRKLDSINPGKKSGSIVATFEWQAPGRGELLEEHRVMTFYADPDIRTIDVDVTLTATRDVRFADTKEGFFAIRLADGMTEKNGGLATNSEGAQTEKSVWGERADWVDYDGTVQGQKVGIVIFDNPQNYNHPPRWHVRGYGLFAVNPFGLKEFDKKTTGAGGGRAMPAGESARFRYRVIIHPGDVPEKKVASWYADYIKKVK